MTVSSKSAIVLLLRNNFGLNYILTQRLNQDCLEHLFGCIRQMNGPYDHPNPLDFKYRLRTLLLRKDVTIISEKTNTNGKFNNQDLLSNISANNSNHHVAKERELALEMCLTSLLFKDLDFEVENDMYSSHKGLSIDDDDIEKSASRVTGNRRGSTEIYRGLHC